jgi:hypothetical protein
MTGSKRRSSQDTADIRGAIRIVVKRVNNSGFELPELNKERLDAVVCRGDRPFQARVQGP